MVHKTSYAIIKGKNIFTTVSVPNHFIADFNFQEDLSRSTVDSHFWRTCISHRKLCACWQNFHVGTMSSEYC